MSSKFSLVASISIACRQNNRYHSRRKHISKGETGPRGGNSQLTSTAQLIDGPCRNCIDSEVVASLESERQTSNDSSHPLYNPVQKANMLCAFTSMDSDAWSNPLPVFLFNSRDRWLRFHERLSSQNHEAPGVYTPSISFPRPGYLFPRVIHVVPGRATRKRVDECDSCLPPDASFSFHTANDQFNLRRGYAPLTTGSSPSWEVPG